MWLRCDVLAAMDREATGMLGLLFGGSRARRVSVRAVEDGPYLTDGRRLFRVVSALDPNAEQPVAALEDCLTLQVRPYTPDELFAMRLRRVRSLREQV
jgi:hypothetical protein